MSQEQEQEEERDTREVTLYDDEAMELMQGWWNGQSDPLYAIYSMGGQNEAWVFQDAISNLDREIGRVKKIGGNRYQLGKGTFSKAEIEELSTLRDALQMALDDTPGEAREASTANETVSEDGELSHFQTWKDVLAYAQTGAPIWYQAPMDHRPIKLHPRKEQGEERVYEAHARTIRVWPSGSTGRGRNRTADPFTADVSHLDRFRRPTGPAQEMSEEWAPSGTRIMMEKSGGAWKITHIIDHGPEEHYRFHIEGENLNYPPGDPSRKISWAVPNLDSLEYDVRGAQWTNQSRKSPKEKESKSSAKRKR